MVEKCYLRNLKECILKNKTIHFLNKINNFDQIVKEIEVRTFISARYHKPGSTRDSKKSKEFENQLSQNRATTGRGTGHQIYTKIMLPFKYAELRDVGSDWLIYYYCYNPNTEKLQRIRQRINSIKSEANRRRYAVKLIAEINRRLDDGYNPFIDDTKVQKYDLLTTAIDFISKYKSTYLRKRSKDSMDSRLKDFKTWLESTKKSKMYVFEFTSMMARAYMNHVLTAAKKGRADQGTVTPRTYNNCLIEMTGNFNLLVTEKYINENPFKGIKKLPEQEKQKQPFTPDQQQAYRDYLIKNDYEFLIISLYCYYCAIRPNEIVHLKVKDINLERGNITVPPGISKNRKVRNIQLPVQFLEILKVRLADVPPEYFICGKGMKPGEEYTAPTRIAEHFRKIADVLKFPKSICFYSLKDTVADRLIEAGFSARSLRDLFGHHDLSVTDNYLRGINAKGDKRMLNEFPEF